MTLQLICGRRTAFDLGFEHGVEAEEDPSAMEFGSRVHEYQLGFIVGRSFSEAVKLASHAAAAATAGALGSRFGIKVDDLLAAMSLNEEHQQIIRQAYANAGACN